MRGNSYSGFFRQAAADNTQNQRRDLPPAIFVRDLQNGTTIRVSVDVNGVEGNGRSDRPSISADGRFIAFYSDAYNLVDGNSSVPSISSNGQYIAFRSDATNLSVGLPASVEQVYIVDRDTMNMMIASTSNAGIAGSDDSSRPAISADGQTVTFYSDAHNFADGDVPTFHAITCASCVGVRDVFVRSLDRDGDQVLEVNDNCPNIANANQSDIDGDHIGDVCDVDRDGDGTLNFADHCPDDPNKSAEGDCGCGNPDIDTDLDGVLNCVDNCPTDMNSNQLDFDTDDIGDVCDDDDDNDLVVDEMDNCPMAANTDQSDADGDGMGDECDPDFNNDEPTQTNPSPCGAFGMITLSFTFMGLSFLRRRYD